MVQHSKSLHPNVHTHAHEHVINMKIEIEMDMTMDMDKNMTMNEYHIRKKVPHWLVALSNLQLVKNFIHSKTLS